MGRVPQQVRRTEYFVDRLLVVAAAVQSSAPSSAVSTDLAEVVAYRNRIVVGM